MAKLTIADLFDKRMEEIRLRSKPGIPAPADRVERLRQSILKRQTKLPRV